MMSEREKQALAVAYLTVQDLQQKEIAEILALSQPDVSRLLRIAREKKFLSQQINWPEDPSLRESIEVLAYPKLAELKERLDSLADQHGGVRPRRVDVVYAGTEDPYRDFGHHAAELLAPCLGQAQTVAVAWGKTIRAIVDAMTTMRVAPRPGMRFLPVSGEPLNHVDTGVSPSAAAARLKERFQSSVKALSLAGIPARIPKSMKASDAEIIRQFFMSSSNDYSEIFSADSKGGPLIARVDMIITGIGDAKSSLNDPWFRETQQAEGMQLKDLERIAVGNLGGVWLNHDNSSKADRSKVEGINNRWLGIQAVHFEECARRANGSADRPGVVVVALGHSKAEIIKRAAGMFNRLVIDRALADEIVGKPGAAAR